MLFTSSKVYSFEVSDIQGNRVNLKDNLAIGHWTFVMVWQLNCVPCEKQKPAIEAFHNQYKSSGLKVIRLNIDGHKRLEDVSRYLDSRYNDIQHLVVLSDVFAKQARAETGKEFNTSPGYMIFSPAGKLILAINHVVDIEKLLSYLETRFIE